MGDQEVREKEKKDFPPEKKNDRGGSKNLWKII